MTKQDERVINKMALMGVPPKQIQAEMKAARAHQAFLDREHHTNMTVGPGRGGNPYHSKKTGKFTTKFGV